MVRYTIAVVLFCVGVIYGILLNSAQYSSSYAESPFSLSQQAVVEINRQMNQLLKTLPQVQQANVSLIHGVGGREHTIADRFQFNIIVSLANQGYDPGPTDQNLPLSQWDDYLPALIANKCPVVTVSNMAEVASKERMQSFGGGVFMVCPIFSETHQLLGGIFAFWGTKPTDDLLLIAEENLRVAVKNIESKLND